MQQSMIRNKGFNNFSFLLNQLATIKYRVNEEDYSNPSRLAVIPSLKFDLTTTNDNRKMDQSIGFQRAVSFPPCMKQTRCFCSSPITLV